MKKENNIKITEDSLNIINDIISKMDNRTFHNHYHILYDLCTSLNKENITYLEIGAYAGGSASLISTHKNVSKVLSIDIGNPIKKEIPISNVTKFKHDNCTYDYIEGDSMSIDTKNKIYSMIDNVDILFIDGDHRYDAVIKDFENYKDLVLPNGYIVFDDYLDPIYSPDVFTAVNDIVNKLDKNEYNIIGSLKYDLIKKTNSPNQPSSNEFILQKIN
jgi:predicted O-methyltransferase YrrM